MPALFRLAVCAIDRPEPVPEAESPVLANCLAAVREAAERGADLVLLPEEPDIIAGGASGEYPLEEHPVFVAFRDAAAACGVGLIATLSVKVGERYANTEIGRAHV